MMYIAVLVEADGHRSQRNALGGRGAGTIIAGSARVTLVAQVMLGITTHQLTFVTSNRALYFGRNPGAFIFCFINYGHPSSYA